MVLEKIPESPLDSMEIKSGNLKGDKPWIFTGRTDAEAEALVLWSPDVNRKLIGKVPDAGKDWGQKKRASEDEIAGRHHQCSEHQLGQTLGDGEGQGGLASAVHGVTKSQTWQGDWTTTQSCPNLCDPCTVAGQAPLSMGFPTQKYWNGCHFLLQGIFPTQGLNPGLLHCRQSLYLLSHQGS